MIFVTELQSVKRLRDDNLTRQHQCWETLLCDQLCLKPPVGVKLTLTY